MFYLVGTFRTSSLGESLSSDPERTAPRGRGGVWLYRSLQQRTGSLNIKSIFVNENQISQIKGLSTFLYMERCKSLCSLKSFLPYASQLSGASITHLYSVLTIGSGCNLKAARSQVSSSFLVALEGWDR